MNRGMIHFYPSNKTYLKRENRETTVCLRADSEVTTAIDNDMLRLPECPNGVILSEGPVSVSWLQVVKVRTDGEVDFGPNHRQEIPEREPRAVKYEATKPSTTVSGDRITTPSEVEMTVFQEESEKDVAKIKSAITNLQHYDQDVISMLEKDFRGHAKMLH